MTQCLSKVVWALALTATLLFSGCTEDSRQFDHQPDRGIYLFSTADEIQLGQEVVRQVQREYKPWKNQSAQARLDSIVKRLVPFAQKDRGDVEYRFHLLDTDEINAFAVPGGDIFVLRGLMEKATDEELAGVLAHELGHVVYRHSLRQLQSEYEMSVLSAVISGAAGGDAGTVADLGAAVVGLSYSRDHESQSDRAAVRYLHKAGYSPRGLIHFFHKLEKQSPSQKGLLTFLSTHPPSKQRMKDMDKEIREKGYGK